MSWDAGAVVYKISAVFSGFLLIFFRLALGFSSLLDQLFTNFGLKRDKSQPERCRTRCTGVRWARLKYGYMQCHTLMKFGRRLQGQKIPAQ